MRENPASATTRFLEGTVLPGAVRRRQCYASTSDCTIRQHGHPLCGNPTIVSNPKDNAGGQWAGFWFSRLQVQLLQRAPRAPLEPRRPFAPGSLDVTFDRVNGLGTAQTVSHGQRSLVSRDSGISRCLLLHIWGLVSCGASASASSMVEWHGDGDDSSRWLMSKSASR